MTQAGHRYELPLFPLHTVLFPRMALPLKVFEPRYRQMMDYCMERGGSFGVVLIRSGAEVGEPAEPHRVGTVARIDEIRPQNDGTLAVSTTGTRRFAIVEILQRRPFQMALVEDLEDPAGPVAPATLSAVRAVAVRCLEHTLALTGEWVRTADLPKDPTQLSYLLSTRLPADGITKQRLLEAPTADDRLGYLLPLLEVEEARLARQVQERMWLTSIHLN